MGAVEDAEITQVRALLLHPTVENVSVAVTLLEMIAGKLALMQKESQTRADAESGYLRYARAVKAELPDLKRLLGSAARMYNRLGTATLAPGSPVCYSRSGLLELASGTHSLFARL